MTVAPARDGRPCEGHGAGADAATPGNTSPPGAGRARVSCPASAERPAPGFLPPVQTMISLCLKPPFGVIAVAVPRHSFQDLGM